MRYGLGGRVVAGVLPLLALFVSTGVEAQASNELVASGHVRIRSVLEPAEVLVGQPAELRVQVLTKTWFLGAPTYPQTLDVPDAVVIPPGAFGVNSTERIGGESYAAQTRSYRIFPVAPGSIAIPPVALEVVVAREDASRSEPLPLATEPLMLEAKIPEAAQGLGLVVAAPRVEVEESWSRPLESLRVGDAVKREVVQRVDRSVPMILEAPTFETPAGIRLYPERPTFEQRSDRGELSGSRVDRVSYVLEKEGDFTLPEIVLPWWDLTSATLRREVLPEVALEVAANPELGDAHGTLPPDEETEEAPRARARGAAWPAIGAAAFLVAFAIALRRRRRGARPHFARSRADDPELRAWRALCRALDGSDPRAVRAALYAWRDALAGLPGPPTLESLARWDDDPETGQLLATLAAGKRLPTGGPAALRSRLAALRRRLHGSSRPFHPGRLANLNPRTAAEPGP